MSEEAAETDEVEINELTEEAARSLGAGPTAGDWGQRRGTRVRTGSAGLTLHQRNR